MFVYGDWYHSRALVASFKIRYVRASRSFVLNFFASMGSGLPENNFSMEAFYGVILDEP